MTIKRYPLESSYYVIDVSNTETLRKKVLDEIESYDINQSYQPSYLEDNIETINKTDWFLYGKGESDLPYIQMFIDHIKEDLKTLKSLLLCDQINIGNVWFQQYNFGDMHSWHTHPGSDLAFVYYAELPDQRYVTEFYNVNTNEIYSPSGVTEGSMLVFPASTIHRSPPIVSSERKTIVAFNATIKGLNKLYDH